MPASSNAQEQLPALLHQNRLTLTIQNGEVTGPGADLLKHEIAAAQFVAIGEEHGTREVPEFASAVCRAMAPHGLDAMAVEAGPIITEKLAQWAASPDGAQQLTAWELHYPDSIAFFNWQSEFQLLTRCEQAAAPHKLPIWGLDQEYLGSPNFLLQQILDSKAGPDVTAKAQALLTDCTQSAKKAFASGNLKDTCMFHAPADTFTALAIAAQTSGNRQALLPAKALVKTQHIYTTHESGNTYEANRERLLLLKQNFTLDYGQLAKQLGRPPRVLLKFGGNHIYKGFDQTNLSDLGNYIAEFADERGLASLHIFAAGARGQAEHGFVLGKSDQPADVNFADNLTAELAFMKPFYAEADPTQWTLFDLRPLRPKLRSLGPVDRELERLILGYDLLVILPRITADPPIAQPSTARLPAATPLHSAASPDETSQSPAPPRP